MNNEELAGKFATNTSSIIECQKMLISKKTIPSILLLASVHFQIGQPVYGATTYTPAQLTKMVANGKPPKQGAPKSRTESLPFSQCKEFVKKMLNSAAADNYPTQSGEASDVAYVQKLWTNDGAILLTCAASKATLIITTSPYL